MYLVPKSSKNALRTRAALSAVVGLFLIIAPLGVALAVGDESSSLVEVESRAEMLYDASDYPGALALVEQALKKAGRSLESGEEPIPATERYSVSLWRLGTLGGRCLLQLREYGRAERVLRQRLIEAEKHFGPVSRETGSILAALGDCLTRLGQFADARALIVRSLEMRQQVHRSAHAEVAESEKLLGVVLHRSGNLAGAEPHYRSAVSLLEELGLEDDPRLANVINNLGNLHENLGDLTTALELNRQALRIYRSAYGPDHLAVSGSLYNIGQLERDLGRTAAAIDAFSESLAIRQRFLGPDHPAHGEIINSLAILHEKQGELNKAEALYRDVVLRWTEQYGPDHPDTIRVTFNLGNVLIKVRKLTEARRRCRQARDYWEQAFGADHPHTAAALHQLSRIERLDGRAAEALPLAVAAARVRLQQSHDDFRILSARQMLSYLETKTDSFGLAMTILEEVDDPLRRSWTPALWEMELARRGRMIGTFSTRQLALLFPREDGDRKLLARYNDARRELAELYFEPQGQAGEQYTGRLHQAAVAKEKLERELTLQSARFDREHRRSLTTVKEVQDHLPPGAALVEFVRYEVYPPVEADPHAELQSRQPSRYAVFVLRGNDVGPSVVFLGDADQIDRLLADVHESVGLTGPRDADEVRRFQRLVGKLTHRIWQPVGRALGQPGLILTVPDGPLHLVNFAGLPSEHGGYLIEEGWLFHYLGSARDVSWFGSAKPSAASSPKLLALGAVDYGRRSSTSEPVSLRNWAALPATVREVDQVAGLFPASETIRLTGTEASEARFRKLAGDRTHLHLATHGFFLSPGHSLRRGSGATNHAPEAIGQENPLLLSGLALAGANLEASAINKVRPEKRSVAGDDGILSAEEVAALDLRTVRCAVLSACNSGRGDIRAGEGVLGLRLAFRLAGAATVIFSLTRVADEDARAWMAHFYRELGDGRPIPGAVRAASLKRLEEIRAVGSTDSWPGRWAPFFSAGDWR